MEFLKFVVSSMEFVNHIEDKAIFEAIIGGIVHHWSDNHGEDVRDIFSDLLEISKEVVEAGNKIK